MAFPPTIREGDKGPVVHWAQYRLTGTTLSFTDIDGSFGPKTAAEVTGSQQMAGITADGIVGLQTWAMPVHAAGQVLADLCGVTGPGTL